MSSSAFETDPNFGIFRDDDFFLLQPASTFNWDVLIARCRALADMFSSSVRDRDELIHKQRQAAGFRQLLATDNWGNTPLHTACFNNPPEDVVTALLDAASAANPPIQITVSLTKDCSSPLLIACGTGASEQIIHALIYPPGNLISAGSLIRQCDAQGETPLSALCTQYELRRKQRRYTGSPCLEDVNLVADNHNSRLFHAFWSNVEAIIRCAWQNLGGGLGEPLTSLLHGCATIADACPIVLSQLVTRSFPHMSATTSRRGVLPLHLALSADPSDSMHPKRVSRRNAMIKLLLQCYPTAAREEVPETNRSPLCTAIASGLHWNTRENDEEGPIQSLWKCAPESIHAIDALTGLYPFLLAASVDTGHVEDDALQVDTIFCILTAYPQLVQELIESSNSTTGR